MKKKAIIAITCVAMLLIGLTTGCNAKADNTEVTNQAESVSAETTVPEIPGVAQNVLSEDDFASEDETEPSEENKTNETTVPVEEETDPTESTNGTEATEPTEETSLIEEAQPQSATVTEYEKYHAMTGAEQKEFMDSFDSIEAFYEWYNNAKAEYDALVPELDADGMEIDMSKFQN